uniref:Venom S1 protease with CUB domain 14 n=1 Tax=Oncocephalus sp. TaxID=2944721 RepID=A0AB38ZER4_9HEMI
MLILYSLLVYAIIGIGESLEKGEDGYIHIDDKRKLKLYEPPINVQNYNYPDQAPAALKQTWTFSSYPWIKLQFTCSLIQIPSNPPCNEHYLEINDGTTTKKYCGEIKDLDVTSSANKIDVLFKTGKSFGGGTIDCQVVGFNPEFTTLAPPTTTKSYLEIESIEIDSSEYGVTPGAKKTNCPCGLANKSPARIVGGKPTEPNEFPFMAALVSREVGLPFCGATIITPYHAITAAHCTIKLTEYGVEGAILVGEHDYEKESKTVEQYNVVQIIQHEGYNNDTSRNDIALVLLDREIKFNQFVGRACLPTKRMNLEHQYVKMLGWGRIHPEGPSSHVLRKVNVRVIPMSDCLDVWGLFIPANEPKHICVYAKNKSSCQGDSGGPVLWLDPETNRYTLVGLTSFGLNCSPNIPSVKTEVAAFLDWINYHIKITTPDGSLQTCSKID